jgi:hypothetical protein
MLIQIYGAVAESAGLGNGVANGHADGVTALASR